MNASYKIVLLGAFVLFAAVVGYYIFSGEGETVDQLTLDDEYPQAQPGEQADDPKPNPRATLEITRPPARDTQPQPTPNVGGPLAGEETIGPTTDELPDAPVIGPGVSDDARASIDPVDDRFRAAPRRDDEPTTDEPQPRTEVTPEDPRPAPGTTSDGPGEETTQPRTDPEPVDEPEAEPSRRPVPPSPTTIPRTYTVQGGDTFASIANRFYGEERAWYDIAQANPSVDPKRLQVGQEIVLPNRETPIRKREEVQPPAPGKDQNYTVRPGDNLSKIAKKFYGDTEQWELIYARNRQLIGPRPDALKVGMEIVIPQAYDGAQ